jgi:hypothetical protein
VALKPSPPVPAEWRWVALWAGLILLITSLPYLYGLSLATPQQQFSGFILGIEDANSYLAKMRQGAAGGWLFRLDYTPEPHAGAYLFTFHLLLGKISAALNLAPVLVYHLARLIFGFILLLTIYAFIAAFVEAIPLRRFAFLVAATGSGLGWLVTSLGLVNRLGLPLDLYVPEAFFFLVLFHLPHLALAESLLLLSLLLTLHSWQSGSWGQSVGAGLALLGMALIAAFYLAVFVLVLGLSWLWLAGLARFKRRAWPRLGQLILPLLIAAPVPLYDAYVFTTNPILKVWSQQNLILSPPFWHYLLAYGLLLVPAVYGAKMLLARPAAGAAPGGDPFLNPRYRALSLVIWSVSFPLLVYLPFNLQRRLVVGVQLPLAILATVALLALFEAGLRPGRRRLAQAATLFLLSLTNLVLLAGSVLNLNGRYPPIFQPRAQLAAAQWLAQAGQGQVVLVAHETGNLLPAYANVRVFLGHGPETVFAETKQAQIRTFFAATTPDSWRIELLRQFEVHYLYYGPHEKGLGEFQPGQATYLEEVYQGDEVQIFRVVLPN